MRKLGAWGWREKGTWLETSNTGCTIYFPKLVIVLGGVSLIKYNIGM